MGWSSLKTRQREMGWVLALARLCGLVVAGLVLVWALTFRASFLPRSGGAATAGDAISQLDHMYSALHPLLMVIGFILLSGEGEMSVTDFNNKSSAYGRGEHAKSHRDGDGLTAILVHRRLVGWSRGTRKSVHLSLQGAALGFGLFGIWAKFRGKEGIAANFYSLHSWMGLVCVALFASQWVVGFMSMWHKSEGRQTRSTVLPWHMFVGLYTFGLAVAVAETGLQEKLTFLQGRRGLARRSPESTLVNTIGIALALLAGIVILAAILPRRHEQVTKFVNGKEAMNGKSYV